MTMKSSVAVLYAACLFLFSLDSVQSQAIVGNVGLYNLGASADLADSTNGMVWKADPFSSSGNAMDACTAFKANTQSFANPDLFCQYREWTGTSSGVLHVPVPATGLYEASLYFSAYGEVADDRIVDIYAEDSKVYGNLDVADRLGGSYGVFTLRITATITDGAFSIEVMSLAGRPALAAVQIVLKGETSVAAPVVAPNSPPVTTPVAAPVAGPVAPSPVSAPTVYLNLGATAPYTDEVTGAVWLPDEFTNSGGSARNVCSTINESFENKDLYCQYREWTDTSGVLNVPVLSSGFYKATLFFINVGDNERVVDVYVEGKLVTASLDIGVSNSYFLYGISRNITDGTFSIEIKSVTGNPVLAAIQVGSSYAPALLATPTPVAAPAVMAPVALPVTTPVASPVAPPVAPPITPPVATPVAVPVTAPAPTPVAAPTMPPPASGPTIYLNLGATAPYTDQVTGVVWLPDAFTSSGGSAQNECSIFNQGFENKDLYCQYREWTDTSGVLNVPVQSSGFYKATLFFVNVGDNERVVDVHVEGQLFRASLAIGGSNSYFLYGISHTIADGAFSIEIKSVKGNPVLAAIQVGSSYAQALLARTGTQAKSASSTSRLEVEPVTALEAQDTFSSSPNGRPSVVVLTMGALLFWASCLVIY